MRPIGSRIVLLLALSALSAGCAAPAATPQAIASPVAATTPPGPSTVSTSAPTPSPAERWAADLDALDRMVRDTHPEPFVGDAEARWVSRIADLKRTLPTMSEDDAKVAIVELVAHLGSHSGVFPEEIGFHYYGLLPYEFADGEFIVAAVDHDLIGSKVVRVGTTPIDEVNSLIGPLVNHDNDSSMHHLRAFYVTVTEFLVSKGVIADVAHPGFVLQRPDGTTVTVDPPVLTPQLAETMPVIGGLAGDTPEFVRRGLAEEIWWRVDKPTRTFLIGYNQAGTDTTAAISAMREALDSGRAKRVALDMRLAGGGGYDPTLPLREALRDDPRINRPGGLVVLISRENESASNALAGALRATTAATFVGEPTPARPDTPGDEIVYMLPNSGIAVHIPTAVQPGVARSSPGAAAVTPDVPVELTAADFFAGRDRTLEVALKGP